MDQVNPMLGTMSAPAGLDPASLVEAVAEQMRAQGLELSNEAREQLREQIEVAFENYRLAEFARSTISGQVTHARDVISGAIREIRRKASHAG